MSLGMLPVMARLRNATVELESELEQALEHEPPSSAVERYRMFLARMYGFLAPLEHRLGTRPDLAQELPDLIERQKAPLIAMDLVAFGVTQLDVEDLPRCAQLPELPDVAAALGCVYVLEAAAGATDGLRGLVPEPLAARSRYLSLGDADADPRWRLLIQAIEQHANVRSVADRTVAGANETLFQLSRWLAPSALRVSTSALR